MANPSFQNIPEESMKWVTASYLLEAKQHIDSLEYISKNIFKLPRYGASTLIPMHFDSFYIECACVLDRFCKNTQQKKSLKDCHPEIGTIYWWRDKQAAHHDESVLGKGLFGLVSEWPNILSKMKRELGCVYSVCKTSVYKGYKQDKIEMRGDRAEMSDFPLYLNTVAGGLDRRDQTIGGFSFVVKIYAVPVVEIIG